MRPKRFGPNTFWAAILACALAVTLPAPIPAPAAPEGQLTWGHAYSAPYEDLKLKAK
ncbi:MAG: hypothetical protein HY726_22390 [Candidatus Rokubacteria bacterium]|nr:hypothetical protein [Candidatus Rokubacteria bacterium]